MFNVVLVNPEIPPNTGNIGRLTLGCDANLIIVGNPSFDLDLNSALQRAGLDYWDKVTLSQYENWHNFKAQENGTLWLVTKFSDTPYHGVNYQIGDYLIFGGENHGVPDHVHEDPDVTSVCLPMTDEIRAFNLCNSVAITIFEGLRQNSENFTRETPYSNDNP